MGVDVGSLHHEYNLSLMDQIPIVLSEGYLGAHIVRAVRSTSLEPSPFDCWKNECLLESSIRSANPYLGISRVTALEALRSNNSPTRKPPHRQDLLLCPTDQPCLVDVGTVEENLEGRNANPGVCVV